MDRFAFNLRTASVYENYKNFLPPEQETEAQRSLQLKKMGKNKKRLERRQRAKRIAEATQQSSAETALSSTRGNTSGEASCSILVIEID